LVADRNICICVHTFYPLTQIKSEETQFNLKRDIIFFITTARVLAGRTAVAKKVNSIFKLTQFKHCFFLFSSTQFKQEPGAHQITREWALRRRRSAAAPPGYARHE